MWSFRQLFRGQLANLRHVSASTKSSAVSNRFFEEDVQTILKNLTGFDVDKVFRKRRDGKAPVEASYEFMTTKQYEEALERAYKIGREKLVMPPVLPERKEIDLVLEKDEDLEGYCSSSFVFTDITYGKNDRNRTIVVRTPDGTLRAATWSERDRMNEVYFPRAGRELWVPEMFCDENIQRLLDDKQYEFILERTCAQFEPDDPKFIEINNMVIDRVSTEGDFNVLRSTRHYGPLVYRLVEKDSGIDSLLIENFRTDRLQDAVWALDLYWILRGRAPKGQSVEDLDYVQDYVEASDNPKLKLAFTKYKDYLKSVVIQKEAIE